MKKTFDQTEFEAAWLSQWPESTEQERQMFKLNLQRVLNREPLDGLEERAGRFSNESVSVVSKMITALWDFQAALRRGDVLPWPQSPKGRLAELAKKGGAVGDVAKGLIDLIGVEVDPFEGVDDSLFESAAEYAKRAFAAHAAISGQYYHQNPIRIPIITLLCFNRYWMVSKMLQTVSNEDISAALHWRAMKGLGGIARFER